MPFRSEAQRRWMYANHPRMAREWEEHTPPGRLPERVKKSDYDDAFDFHDYGNPVPPLPNIPRPKFRKTGDFDYLAEDSTFIVPHLRAMHKLGYVLPKQLQMGRKVELEHAGTVGWLKRNPDATVEEAAERIAKDHLRELPDYYTRLEEMEEEGKRALKGKEKVSWSWEGFKEGLRDEGIPLSGATLGAALGAYARSRGIPLTPLTGAALGYAGGAGASLLRSKLKGEKPSTAQRVLAYSGLGYGLGGLTHGFGAHLLEKGIKPGQIGKLRKIWASEAAERAGHLFTGRERAFASLLEEGMPALGATTATGLALATDKKHNK